MFSEYEKGRTLMFFVREIDVFHECISLGAGYATGHYCKKSERVEWSQYINYLLVLIAIKINPTSFVNYHKNNWLNHYFLLGVDQTRSA
jgi:hypothetical protein